jgi:hypothetical protein
MPRWVVWPIFAISSECAKLLIMETLHKVLQSHEPVALGRIEKVLAAEHERSEEAEAAVSALLWRRQTAGHSGIRGTFLNRDCVNRIRVLATHLDRVGAHEAAEAMRELRGQIPYKDTQLGGSIIDWVDANPDFVSRARELDDKIDDIAPQVWAYMQNCSDDLPDAAIPSRRRGLFARLFN